MSEILKELAKVRRIITNLEISLKLKKLNLILKEKGKYMFNFDARENCRGVTGANDDRFGCGVFLFRRFSFGS